jgi:hypothetical protein
MTRNAASKRASILRGKDSLNNPRQIPIDLRRILSGESPDVPLQTDDILFVPHNTAKAAANRALDAAINVATGVIIWRR